MFRAAAASSLPAILRRLSLRQAGRVALACSALALLSACGGGDRAEEYKPDRIVVFGDENSAFKDEAVPGGTLEGLVYTVNALTMRALKFCTDAADVATPTAPCTTPYVAPPYIQDFDITDLTLPFGTGVMYSGVEDYKNAIRFVALGTATFDTTPAATTATAKQDFVFTYSCDASVTAAQRIAHTFGKGFQENCAIDSSGAFSHAAAGAKISNLQAQVNQASAAGQLGKGTLTVVWIGHNDIIDIVEDDATYGTLAAKRLEAKIRADRLAQVVIQIMKTGAKVAVIGVADLGYSPWAVGTDTVTPPACAGTTRSACAVQLVADFNSTLKLGDPKGTGLKGLQDYTFRGREYTFVEGGAIVDSLATNGSYVNKKVCAISGDTKVASPANAAASEALPSIKPDGTIAVRGGAPGNIFPVEYCSTQSLVFGGSTDTYLWADERRPAPIVHQAIANAVLVRVINQF